MNDKTLTRLQRIFANLVIGIIMAFIVVALLGLLIKFTEWVLV